VRIVLYCLALANLLFFAWANWVDVPATAVTSGPGVASLQLAPGAAAAPTSRCLSLGPFETAETASTVTAALAARGVVTRERQTERQVPDGFLVYVEGLESPAARQRAISRLARAGITDAAELPPGVAIDRISVGLFSGQDGAQQRVARARAAGFDPKIENRVRTIADRWLDTDLKLGVNPPPISELLAGPTDSLAAKWLDCPVAGGTG
jgi:hypothetical protein